MVTVERTSLLDVVRRLLESEQSGLFGFLTAADPYVSRAVASKKRLVQNMITEHVQRMAELGAWLEELGGVAAPLRPNLEHQHLAYLSFEYLLPRLRDDKARSIGAYERAIAALGEDEEGIKALLQSHLASHKRDLEALAARTGGAGGAGGATSAGSAGSAGQTNASV